MNKHKSVDLALLLCVTLLLFVGVMMVFSSSFYYALAKWENMYYFLVKDLIWIIAGLFAMTVFMNIDYHKLKYIAIPLLVASFIGLLLIFSPFGKTVNGATRWLTFGKVDFMPSEFSKFAIIIFCAYWIDLKKNVMKSFTKGFLPFILIMGVYAFLIIKQPNLSTAITICTIITAMIFVGGMDLRHFGMLLVGASVLLVPAIAMSPYRLKRFLTFLDPFKDTAGDGYQVVQSLYALGHGGLFGVGIGQSTQNKLYLPEPQNDFIFATIGEELGFVGSSIILLIFLVLIYRGFKIAVNAPDRFGTLLATGITSMVSVHLLINIAVVTSSMPVTGLPLPFISYGGNFMLFLLSLIGILLNISKQTVERKSEEIEEVI